MNTTCTGQAEGESVEVDAIPPEQLRELVRDCIESNTSMSGPLEVMEIAEQSERDILQKLVKKLGKK